MQVQIHPSWEKALRAAFEDPYLQNLIAFVKEEYQNTLCFPPRGLIFNAFNKCPLNDVKVVVLGQDPYHGKGQADGL